MRDRNAYPKTATKKRFAEEWTKANPNYVWVGGDMIQRIEGKWWNPPKHFADLIKLFVDIKYLVRNATGVKGSPWKWACEYRVMMEIREFPYNPENRIRSVAKEERKRK